MIDAERHVLAGGGEMGERLRNLDWNATALGPVESWPEALRTLVALMLASNQPMYIVWGPSRAFLYNDHYVPFLGGKHPGALGRDILQDVWPEIRGELEPLIAAAAAGDPIHVPSMRLVLERNGDPEETYFSFFFAPVRDASGAVAGMFGACNDITAQMQLQRELSASDARHRQVLANMDEAFVLFDRDFHIVEVNPVTERLTRLGREQLIGQRHWDLFPGTLDSPLGEMYLRARATGHPGRIEYHYQFDANREGWFEVRAIPVEEGLAVFFHDITQRRLEAEAAKLAAERVQLALDAGAILGTWVWLVREDRISGDGRFAHLFGLDEQACLDGIPLGVAFDAIHPDDRARVSAAIDDVLARGGRYRCEYRVLTRDGTWAWVEANGRVEQDETGAPVRFPGGYSDTTSATGSRRSAIARSRCCERSPRRCPAWSTRRIARAGWSSATVASPNCWACRSRSSSDEPISSCWPTARRRKRSWPRTAASWRAVSPSRSRKRCSWRMVRPRRGCRPRHRGSTIGAR
jgi:PAS domain S-box-containing protein